MEHFRELYVNDTVPVNQLHTYEQASPDGWEVWGVVLTIR